MGLGIPAASGPGGCQRNVQKDPINLLFPAGVTSKDGYAESLIRSNDRPVKVEVDG